MIFHPSRYFALRAKSAALVGAWFALSLLFVMISTGLASGTDYYVSSSKGANQNNGLSAEHPFQTLNKFKNFVFKDGDRLLLKRGDTWREALAIQGSGSETGFLEISSYGEGPKPILNGSEALSGWMSDGEGRYRLEYKGDCRGLLENGKPMRKASGPDLRDGSWYFDGAQINYRPSVGHASDHLVECCSKANDVRINSRNNVSINGIAIYGTNDSGVWIVNSSQVQIRNCTATANAGQGIGIFNNPKRVGSPCSDIFIQGNTVSWNGEGIYLFSENGAAGYQKIYVIGNLVEYSNFNEVWGHRDGHGIGIQNTSGSYFGENEIRYNFTGPCLWTASARRSDNNVFARNFVHHNQQFGMNQSGNGHDNAAGNLWCFNIITDNGTDKGLYGGLRISQCTRSGVGKNEFSNNTLARNDVNVYLYALTDYDIIKQNISYAPKLYHVLIYGGLGHNVLANNLYYPGGAALFGVGKDRRLDFAGWQTKTGQDRGSRVADPLFNEPSPRFPKDFTPVGTSPAFRVPKERQMPEGPKWIKNGPGFASETEVKRPDKYLGVDYLGKPLGSQSFIGAIGGQQ